MPGPGGRFGQLGHNSMGTADLRAQNAHYENVVPHS